MKRLSKWQPDYDRLVEYCIDHGWSVQEEKETVEASVDEDVIEIGSLICQPLKLFSLLHEVGHLLVWSDNYKEKFPGYDKSERHKHHQVAFLEEEIKAWDKGLVIANELSIEFDMKKWHDHRYDCIHAYIRDYRKNTKKT